jgi:CRISPR/Cas system-associated exonuclease Cas4 (RecB family)
MQAGEIVSLFLEKVWKEVNNDDRDGLHVTELVELATCPRKVWFRKKEPVPPEVKSILRMWKGKKLHETAITINNEVEVELDGVQGRIDEVYENPEKITVIDKKFVTFLPKNDRDVQKYYSHYMLQAEIYAYMLKKGTHDDRAFECALLFVNTEEEPFFYVHFWEPDFSEVEKKFHELIETAGEILKAEHPPERNPEFMPSQYPCTYCDYTSRCYIHPEFNSG